MGTFFKNNDFKTDYKKHPNDEYKAALDKLDEETKRRFDRRRTWILVGVVAVVFCLVVVLAVTGIGTNKAQSAGTILDGSERAQINVLGDSFAEGADTCLTSLQQTLQERLGVEISVAGYRDAEGKAQNTSYKQMQEACDIAIIQYLAENLKADEDPEGVLEANIDGLMNQGTRVYLLNYPIAEGAEESAAYRQANQYIAKAAKAKNVLLLDADAKFKGLLEQGRTAEELFEADGVHLTEEGQKQLGIFLAEGLISDAGLD